MPSSTVINTVFKLHQKEYDKAIPIRIGDLGVPETSWVWLACVHEAERSQAKRSQHSEARAVVEVLLGLSTTQAWLEVAALKLQDVQIENVMQAFRIVELHIAQRAQWAGNTKHSHSLRTRALLTRYLTAAQFKKVTLLRSIFKSGLPPDRSKHRQLISDQPIQDGEKVIPPIGALPHENIAQLKLEAQRALQAPLDQIDEVCSKVLDAVDVAFREREKMLAEAVPRDLLTRLAGFIKTSPSTRYLPDWLMDYAVDEVARAYVRLIHQPGEFLLSPPRNVLRGAEVDAYLVERFGLRSVRRGIVFFPLGIAIDPLLACLLSLQKDTAWNSNVVLELTTAGVWLDGDTAEIQSFKSRVNKESSTENLDSKHQTSIRALKFLIARLEFMKKWGGVQPDETRLWLNHSASGSKTPKPYVGWGSALKLFQRKWKLPDFSFEQVRVQALCLTGQQGGLEAMRRKAHHASIKTTGSYDDQLLNRRLNEASNLEFQRRLEQQIVYVDESERRPDASHLLLPIGDGTACKNPEKPPFEDYLDGGLCNGKRCHSEGGCPNNRVIIDRDRVEEAARTEHYYNENWVRLIEANEDAFRTFHLPSLAFNKCLLQVLSNGPYAHVVRDVRKQLVNESNHG
jgi:hypothetical protein